MPDNPLSDPTPEPNFEMSARGFKHLEAIGSTYGAQVRVYESSAASEPCVWLAIGKGGESLRAHLTVDQARAVAEQLLWLCEHHYQGVTP